MSDSRITLGYITQSWTDIRAYTSNIWQVTAVGMAVVALVLNVILSSFTSDKPLDGSIILILLFFAFVFVGITSYSIEWFRKNIAVRVQFMSEVEEKMIEIAGPDKVISGTDLFHMKHGPLRILLALFYFITSILSGILFFLTFLEIYPLLFSYYIDLDTYRSVLGLCTIIISSTTLIICYERYKSIRVYEKKAETQEEKVKDIQRVIIRRGLDHENAVHELFERFSNTYDYILDKNPVFQDEYGRVRPDATISKDDISIPIEARTHLRGRDPYPQVFRQMEITNSKLAIIVVSEEVWEIRKVKVGQILVMGVTSKMEQIQSWIEKTLKQLSEDQLSSSENE